MSFDFLEKNASKEANSAVGIIVISGTCCNPNLKFVDNQALNVIKQAAAETAVEVSVKMMTLSSAYYSAPKDVRQKLMGDFAAGRMDVPAILVDGKAASYGVPSLEDMKAALLGGAQMKMKERTNE